MAAPDGDAAPGKFVVRKLPPKLAEADFYKLLTDVCKDELDWFRYHPGSFESTGMRTSTAFLKLKHPELAPLLKHVLQQTPFTGEHGVQYYCEMEVALFQKVPKLRGKKDPYLGTYTEDPFYEQFLKECESEDEAAARGPSVTATTTIEAEPQKDVIITPLMQHIIDSHAPKTSSSGRSRQGRGKRDSKDTREKENQKRVLLPTIQEGTQGKGGEVGDAPKVRGKGRTAVPTPRRGSTTVQSQQKATAGASDKAEGQNDTSTSKSKREKNKDKGSKRDSKESSSAGGKGSSSGGAQQNEKNAQREHARASDGGTSSEALEASRIAAQAAARVAAQLSKVVPAVSEAGGSTHGDDAHTSRSSTARDNSDRGEKQEGKNGRAKAGNGVKKAAKSSPAKASKSSRGRRESSTGGQSAPATPEKCASKGSQSTNNTAAAASSSSASTSTADRVAQAAAAAAAAALKDSPVAAAEARPRPTRRPALGARGVREALSLAGIKKLPGASPGTKSGAGVSQGGDAGS